MHDMQCILYGKSDCPYTPGIAVQNYVLTLQDTDQRWKFIYTAVSRFREVGDANNWTLLVFSVLVFVFNFSPFLVSSMMSG